MSEASKSDILTPLLGLLNAVNCFMLAMGFVLATVNMVDFANKQRTLEQRVQVIEQRGTK